MKYIPTNKKNAFTLTTLLAILISFYGCAKQPHPPVYNTTNSSEFIVTEVSASLAQRVNPPASPSPIHSKAIGRTYNILSNNDLSNLVTPDPTSPSSTLSSTRSFYYNIWSLIEQLDKSNFQNTAIQLEFILHSEKDSTAYLAIGANDSVLIMNNGILTFGLFGYRENRHAHHTIPLQLSQGNNKITIHFQKNKEWTDIPNEHLTDEWSATLEIFGSEDIARSRQKQRNPHPFDTAVVSDLNSLKAEGYYGVSREIELFDMHGNKVAFGVTRTDTSIAWESIQENIEYPLLGIATVNKELGEPVFISGSDDISGALNDFKNKTLPQSGGWGYRLEHLLKERFSDIRDVWWGRKLAITACKILSNERLNAQIEKCPSLLIRLGELNSKLDGTTQYYRYFRNENISGPRTLVVMIPTWPGILIPYLELLADQQFPERAIGLAQLHGMDLLLAGGLNADMGGQLALFELNENIQDYIKKFGIGPNDKIYLVGPCSAALTALAALNYNMNIDGAVLWTPVVHRRRYSYNMSTSRLPIDVLNPEQTDSKIESLKPYQVYVYWDSNASGHGDYTGTHSLVERAKIQDCNIDTKWLSNAGNKTLWGPREAISINEWMEWILQSPTSQRHAPKKLINWSLGSEKPQSVKEALLAGFSVSSEFQDSEYSNIWKALIKQYRGATAKFPDRNNEAPTIISHREVSIRDHHSILVADEEIIKRPNWKRSITKNPSNQGSPLWGFRLIEKGEKTVVEVLSSLPPEISPPQIDLLTDGCCRSAFWGWNNEEWRLEYFQL